VYYTTEHTCSPKLSVHSINDAILKQMIQTELSCWQTRYK